MPLYLVGLEGISSDNGFRCVGIRMWGISNTKKNEKMLRNGAHTIRATPHFSTRTTSIFHHCFKRDGNENVVIAHRGWRESFHHYFGKNEPVSFFSYLAILLIHHGPTSSFKHKIAEWCCNKDKVSTSAECMCCDRWYRFRWIATDRDVDRKGCQKEVR